MSDFPPLLAGLPDRGPAELDACGGCEGADVATPRPLENRPGLSEIAYRPGTYAAFLASQLARLSAAENVAVRRLKSRETEDFSIALIDAWSCVCEVLGFYQERNANEAFLGTATERRSMVELGRLIGYRLRPGVAAGTDLVFLLDSPPGIAGNAVRGQVPAASVPTGEVPVPARTRVQSIPGPGETAQTFETVEDLTARVAWNALLPRQARFIAPRNGDLGCWLKGVVTNLKVGDAIVIVGSERLEDNLGSERWDFRKLTSVVVDASADRTWIAFTHPLGSISPPALTAQAGHRIFAFRGRASLFGWSAPHPNLLTAATRALYGVADGDDWAFTIGDGPLLLDGIQEGWVAGSLTALTKPGYVELYRISASVDDGAAAYAISARTTRLTLDTDENLTKFQDAYRRVSAYGRSEELEFAETPIMEPVMGDVVELTGMADAMTAGRRLVVRGRLAQALVATQGLQLTEAGAAQALSRGERVTLVRAPRQVAPGSAQYEWRLRAPGGFEGGLTAPRSSFRFIEAEAGTEVAAEASVLASLALADDTHAELNLADPLVRAYDRATCRVHANVAAATHGETTQEILGDGEASRPFQAFQLKQAPLTHVSAPTENGTLSSLELRVNDVLWKEASTVHGRAASERVFETRTTDEGATILQFGDGVSGARLPSGRNNVVATYRKGIGRAGSVKAGALTTALDRPLGLREVFNPIDADGGEDPETSAGARENAPVTTLTLGRVVSLRNYEDFARGFAGISKAKADWAWDGEARRILVTVAGPGGSAVDPATGNVFQNLVGAMRTLGDPFVRLTVASFRPATFKLRLRVLVAPDHLEKRVLADVESALREAYGIERRGFSTLVASSEIFATAHSVAGVAAVDLDLLHRTTPPSAQPILHDRLLAQPARLSAAGTLLAAEILTLDPGPIDLQVMT